MRKVEDLCSSANERTKTAPKRAKRSEAIGRKSSRESINLLYLLSASDLSLSLASNCSRFGGEHERKLNWIIYPTAATNLVAFTSLLIESEIGKKKFADLARVFNHSKDPRNVQLKFSCVRQSIPTACDKFTATNPLNRGESSSETELLSAGRTKRS